MTELALQVAAAMERLQGKIDARTPEEYGEMVHRSMELHYEQAAAQTKAAFLKNDVGEPIDHHVCPACMSIADGTAAGWNGPLGDEIGCQLPRGHEGDHRYVIEWTDSERSYGWGTRVGT